MDDSTLPTIWGIHNDTLGAELIEQACISIGWEEIGDLSRYQQDREHLKKAVRRTYPSAKAGAIPVWAGVLHRFASDIKIGDLIIAPYKPDSTLNFGVVNGPYEYRPELGRHPHRRAVRWIRTSVARGLFPQAALYEIGSAVTLFQVRKNDAIFRRFLESASEEKFEQTTSNPAAKSSMSDDSRRAIEDEPNADRIEQHTRDFIIRVLRDELTDEEFEHFIADLLRSMGYQARVTSFGADGGVDVLAHKDPLGLEPPLIKVQCKHTTSSRGRPDIQQLIGTLAAEEVGLFVTLGAFSREADALERERRNLRLLGGNDITRLVLENYHKLSTRWRERLPLRPLLVVDRAPESQ